MLSKQNEISLKIAKHQEKAELPKRELVVFDGTDVTEYSSFIRSFMRTVHSKCEDDADKLFYLEQYTAGLAKQFVKSCNSSDATKAYKQALKILAEEYGNEHRTSTAYLEKLEKWQTIKSEDGKALQEFSIYLMTCANSMESMTALNQLNSPKEIMSVVMKLPFELRKKWRSKTLETVESRHSVTFHGLVEFVRKEAKLVNQPLFGSIKDAKQIKQTVKQRSLLTNLNPDKNVKIETELESVNSDKNFVSEPELKSKKTEMLCFYCIRRIINFKTVFSSRKYITLKNLNI